MGRNIRRLILSIALPLPLALAGCGGGGGKSLHFDVGRAIMVDQPIFATDLRGDVPPALIDGIWGAMPDARNRREKDIDYGAAIRFTNAGGDKLALSITPAAAKLIDGRVTFESFGTADGAEMQKGNKPADYAYVPDVPVRLVPVGTGHATEFTYGNIHMLGYLNPRQGSNPGYDWNVWLDEKYLASVLPAEPGLWWRIRGFFTRLLGIKSDTAVRYRWEIVYPTADGERAGKDIRFLEGGPQLADFVRRHADRMFLKSRAIELRQLTPEEAARYRQASRDRSSAE